MAELKYWLWLATRRGQRRDALALLDHFGAPDDVYFAGEADLRRVLETGFEPFLDKSMAEPLRIRRECEETGCDMLTLHDARYPDRLRNIFDPPLVLYVKGRLPDLEAEPVIAMVGTRGCTPYGVVTAEKLGYETARYGGIVATGLARGIDSAAARGALRAGGRVIGVLGCGVDTVYPKSNGPLYEDVAATGALISEFPPGTQPLRQNFPIRNRVLSGISLGVTVVEAPERSGALITAALALEQGRDVFAVPGNIDAPSCQGSNGLLKEGAHPALSGWDIMSLYAPLFPDRILSPEGDAFRPLDPQSREELVDNEVGEGAKRRPRWNGKATEKPESRREIPRETTKKEIDNTPSAGYSDIELDPGSLTLDERTVLDALKGRTHLDDIITASGLPSQAVLSALTMLEITGAVSQEPGRYYVPHFRYRS